jgi:hypothetical protein
MNNPSRSSGPKKISSFVQTAIYLVIMLSVVAIGVAVDTLYADSSNIEMPLYLLAIGIISITLAIYIMFQSRKRIESLKIETLPVTTIIECIKCGIKTTREFQRGDYIYKELDKCTKCEDKQVITAIYREVKEKEKPVNV